MKANKTMCKLLIATNLSQLDTPSVRSLERAIAAQLGKSQNDGYGFAMLDTNAGLIWRKGVTGETGHDLFKAPGVAGYTPPQPGCLFGIPVLGMPPSKPTYGTGEVEQGQEADVTYATFHGRTSTNNREPVANHPHVKLGISLVHNGVMYERHGTKLPKPTTGNDSESILDALILSGIDSEDIEAAKLAFSGISDYLSGYASLGVIDGGRKRLFIMRDERAPLYMSAYRFDDVDADEEELNSDIVAGYVFASDTALLDTFYDGCEGVYSAASAAPYVMIKPNTLITFGGLGELPDISDVTPWDKYVAYAGYNQSAAANKAFGDNKPYQPQLPAVDASGKIPAQPGFAPPTNKRQRRDAHRQKVAQSIAEQGAKPGAVLDMWGNVIESAKNALDVLDKIDAARGVDATERAKIEAELVAKYEAEMEAKFEALHGSGGY